MSFLSSLKLVSLYDNNLPKLNVDALKALPTKTQMLEIFGGKGGNIGEKSYKPLIEFKEGVGTPNSALDVQTDLGDRFYAKEIKDENDCGHAIKIIENSSNKSQVNIGYINSTSDINIYASSEQLKFANLYSGVATTANLYNNGSTVADFTVRTNGTEQIETILDTELGLNKYYFDLNGSSSGNTCTKFLTKNVNNASTDTTNLLNVFVSEIDVNDNYISYIVSDPIPQNQTSTSVTITIETAKAFASGDIIIIGDITNDSNYIFGTVTSYNSGTGSLSFHFNKENRRGVSVSFPIGSFVTIYQIYQWSIIDGTAFSHCISTAYTDTNITPDVSSLRESYSSVGLDGFRFKYKRSKTNNSIIDYKNKFTWFKNSFLKNISFADPNSLQYNIVNNGDTGDPNFNFDRIGDRQYLKSQYTGVPQLIRKNKFSIMFNGFYQYNSYYQYFHGYYKSNFIMQQLHKSMLVDPKNYLITLGSGAYRYDVNNFRPYFSHKLYEILSYRNIQDLNTGNPQRIIVDYLIKKYKEKALFGSSEIQNNKDIYYSQVDRPNIFGKINKILI